MLEISNGSVNTSATVPGTWAVISCHGGYRLNNDTLRQTAVITCNETGQWLPSDVDCKRISC